MSTVSMRFSISAFLTATSTALCQSILDLGSQQWTLSSDNVTVTGKVPSNAHLDLFEAGVIGDPLYGANDTALLWVQRMNWTYSTNISLSVDSDLSEDAATWLVFDGLDTFAYIELCNQSVGNTDNQFRQWYFDVSEIVQLCNTLSALTLSVNFGSATKIAANLAENGDSLVNYFDGGVTEEFCCKEFIRKQQSDFGWDWAPQLSPAGIWQPARLVQLSNRVEYNDDNDALMAPIYVRNTLIDIYRQGQMNNIPPEQSQPFIFNASLDFLGVLPEGSLLQLILHDTQKGNETILATPLDEVYSSNDTITGSVTIDPSVVSLWWPVGLGDQNLYYAIIEVVHNDNILAKVDKRVGFRTIVLNILNVTDSQIASGVLPGCNWNFEVNGNEFYAKGSNLVPPDVFWPRVNEKKIRNLFETAVIGNQNMLRIWSSGAYLPDWIYDIADEMGILLWSEFEFSDGVYPTNRSYIEQYVAEANYQVRRINHHPSLALWVGGNELEAILLAYYFSATEPGRLQRMYEQIQEELLIQAVYANTRSISYIPSSTYQGFLELNFSSSMPELPRYDNTSGPNFLYADTDFYNYDTYEAFDVNSYPIGRFATEFGFQSMPSIYSWQQVVPQDQLSFFSDIVIHRNRHYGGGNTTREQSISGLQQMTTAVEAWYPVPNMADPIANFSAWCWSTQVFQADYYTSELAFFRRGAGATNRNMGSLYWQLEDLWTAPTWASIEVDGRWKVLMYRAKDIYQPVVGYSFYNSSTGELEIWAMSDLWSVVTGNLQLSWTHWNGSTAMSVLGKNKTNFSIPFTIEAINSTLVYQTNIHSDLASYNETDDIIRDLVLRVDLSARGTPNSDRSSSPQQIPYSHTSYFHPATLQDANLQDPALTLAYKYKPGHREPHHFIVTATRAVAAWVWLDHPLGVGGYFSDNGFWLMSGEQRIVTFTVKNDWTWGLWTGDVVIRTLDGATDAI
ncbi:hypothetical protein UA08_08773 [Talaromyces atroroseus]|uniref:Beta-mannosidase A n=1 Tax=Talaromyces atroroseus TaxID=1441469 RepID=A0A225ARB2_TALAT|nr:hypothetical protein UA08_08773 [Talaromyces atroroseus]OKL55987.1 hypothetical protein UA08_08773 [Talaromyces atroroseus]